MPQESFHAGTSTSAVTLSCVLRCARRRLMADGNSKHAQTPEEQRIRALGTTKLSDETTPQQLPRKAKFTRTS